MILKKVLPLMWLLLAGLTGAFAQSSGSCFQDAIVSTRTGETTIGICQGDALPDIFRFKTTPAAMPFGYLVTDENNVILAVSSSNIINLEGFPIGTLRVWAFSYLGGIIAQPGQVATEVQLGGICSGLSANFITVNSINPSGGVVTTAQGASSAFACVDNTGSSVLDFTSTTFQAGSYSFVVTTTGNIIVATATGTSFDFGTLPAGAYRVWGVAHAGPLTAVPGANITSTVLSSQCFGLSSTFVDVVRGDADGGTVSTAQGDTEVLFCQSTDITTIELAFQTASSAAYVFVLTNQNNVILALLPGNVLDPLTLAPGIYRIWGLSYSGNITAQVGDNAATVELTDACFDLSDNFVSLIVRNVKGGTIEIDGIASTTLCVGDGEADIVAFSSTGASGGDFVLVVTDEDNRVLAVSSANSIDFDGFAAGNVRVWGLSYTGILPVQVGQDVSELLQDLECAGLSENFIDFTLIFTDGGSVSLADGSLSINVCTGDGEADVLTFITTSTTTNYVFVVTDANDNIIAFSASGVVDFEGSSVGIARVWGLSYSGNVLVQVGDNATAGPLTDECFDLSDNFVTVDRRRARGGNVSISNGEVFARLCVNDGVPAILSFQNNSGFAPNYAYVVTDESNTILLISTSPEIDFDDLDPGIVRVWGLSYTGNVTAQVGDNAAAVALSDECYDLSVNFVVVDLEAVSGGILTTLSGATELAFCSGDGFSDFAIYGSSAQGAGNFVFLITDANNTVLVITSQGFTDFESFGAGTYRIWGLGYTGALTVQVGNNAATTDLSNRCFALSENFITVDVNSIDGGVVSLLSGGIFFQACAADGLPDVPQISSTANDPNADYTWLLTTEDNLILDVSDNAAFDFDDYAPGNYRIWGLGYVGALVAEAGLTVGTDALASDCFGLSANYIEVRVDATVGGEISIADGRSFISICIGDDLATPPVDFATTGFSSGNYIYIITDEDNVIVDIPGAQPFGFADDLLQGNLRIWGLAYSGNLLAQLGDDAATTALSDGCFGLSDNFIPLIAGSPEGGTIAFIGADDLVVICPDNGIEDVFQFFTNSGSVLPYTFLITDTDNIIIDIVANGEYDFDQPGLPAELRVWGLSYAGELLAQPGDDAAAVQLSVECFELSENFLSVLRQRPDGGKVQTDNGQTEITVCAGDPTDNIFFLTDSEFRGDYEYVITDQNNIFISYANGNTFNFESLSIDTVRVWGLAYTGNILAGIDTDLGVDELSDDCFDLSLNFITVYRANPQGGVLVTADSITEYLRCAGDGISDLIDFNVVGAAANAPYLYLITDENNYLIGFTLQSDFDFENAIEGIFRIYGFSYTGIFQLFPGDSIFGPIPAASGCFDFSDNFIEINNVRVNGGTVFTDTQETTFYTCPADGVPDIITFFNTSNAPNATYAYLLTNENNAIVGFLPGNSFNFDIAGIGITHVWGVSFTGNFTGNFGDIVTSTQLSDECFSLSSNFIRVIRDVPMGGLVSTTDLETEIQICQNVDDPFVTAITSSTSLVAYRYYLTDVFGEIITSSDAGVFDFSGLPEGTYRIWGVSYTGSLNDVDNILNVDLGTSCLEISGNFIVVHLTEPIVGGTLTANQGLTEILFCPNDGVSDLVEVETNSPTSAASYRYVVTNATGLVLIPNLGGNSIDFEGAGFGEYRIYGVAFTGNYTVGIGTNINTADLSDDCFDLSDNFISIIGTTADGGTVTTDDGETVLQIEANDGEPDVFGFISSTTSGAPYLYILTDAQNMVLEYLDFDFFDFEGQDGEEVRIWGLSYFGDRPDAIGVPVGSLVSGSECIELSDNFIRVVILDATPLTGGSTTSTLRATVHPNPATDRVMLNLWSESKQSATALIRIMDATGRTRQEYRTEKFEGFRQTELDINRLEDGIYTVHISTSDATATVRVVKKSL
jgi:hypothetical protein